MLGAAMTYKYLSGVGRKIEGWILTDRTPRGLARVEQTGKLARPLMALRQQAISLTLF
jgi:hypothetical protein